MDPKTSIALPDRERPERMELEPSAINSVVQLSKVKTRREAGRKTVRLLNEATMKCTGFVNLFFKFLSSHKDDVEAQAAELARLNKLWCEFVRARSDRYVYTETGPFFLLKIQFMIGDKKFNQEQMDKIKNSGEVDNTSKTL